MKRNWVLLAIGWLLATVGAGAQGVIDPAPIWTVDVANTAGAPVPIGGAEHCTGFLITRGDGTIAQVGTDGKIRATQRMELPADSSAAVADLYGNGNPVAITMDCQGSVYAFDLKKGARLWKFTQTGKARDFRLPVTADLDGDGKREILIADSRGAVVCLNRNGHLRMRIDASPYRVSAPAVGAAGKGRFGLIYGTEAGDIDCVDRLGRLLWTTHLGGGFGRSLPLLLQGPKPIVLITRSFVDAHPALCALDATNGHLLWTAPCASQSYQSIAVASLSPGAQPSILFGDKHTRLYCVDREGRQQWKAQLGGRGIFFTPAIADLNGTGAATLFVVVRAAGEEGHSLYVLDNQGKIIDAIPLPGGGGSAPLLCRFPSESELRLITLSGGKLNCYRLHQGKDARILWTGPRNDPGNAGSVGVAPYRHPVPEISRSPGAAGVKRTQTRSGVIYVFLARQGHQTPPQAPKSPQDVREEVGLWTSELSSWARGWPLIVLPLNNPWRSHSPLDFVHDARTGPFDISMLGNAYQSEALVIINVTGETKRLHVEVVGPPGILIVRDCAQVVPSTTGVPIEDPLPSLAEGNVLAIEPDEPHKLWLTFCSRGLAPGTYHVTLQLGDPASIALPTEYPITVTVLPIVLPEKRVYHHINWLYLASIADPILREKTLRDALDHGTNVFNVPPCSVRLDANGAILGAETTAHDAIIRRLRGQAEFLIDGSVNLIWPDGAKPTPEIADRAYTAALRWYVGHQRELGCGYDDYALYLADEPGITGGDSSFRHYVEMVRKVKAADPQLRIFCNPAGGASAEVLAPIADSIDIWCPDLHLVKAQPPALQMLFHHKGEYWHYEAPGDQRHLDPLGFYRMQPWVAFRYGMTGGGYWVYSQTPGWFLDPLRNGEYGAVYPTPDGPVPSKRWEATREGIQDFELLWMLKEACEGAQGAEAQKALKLLDEAVKNVTKGQENVTDISRQAAPLSPDYAAWMRYRAAIIQELIRLKRY